MKLYYRDPLWMTRSLNNKLKKRNQLVKPYFEYGINDTNLEKLVTKSNV